MVDVAHLCDTKWDVAHIESAGLSSHLAPNHRHGGGSHRQAVWSHGGKEGCGWDLACSWRRIEKGHRIDSNVMHCLIYQTVHIDSRNCLNICRIISSVKKTKQTKKLSRLWRR